MNSVRPLGPWEVGVHRDRDGAYNDIEAPGQEWPDSKVALVSCDNPRYREIQALICAAPELLALARKYASECAMCGGTNRDPWNSPNGKPCTDCADIRAVIAKAEGAK